mmetsp:Transcript_83142/g.269158  ORF Transcript_83142/g.269158 Transcript_83142/m.269158 type:complete len:394 (-) Transcript_83142:699-1880(-)
MLLQGHLTAGLPNRKQHRRLWILTVALSQPLAIAAPCDSSLAAVASLSSSRTHLAEQVASRRPPTQHWTAVCRTELGAHRRSSRLLAVARAREPYLGQPAHLLPHRERLRGSRILNEVLHLVLAGRRAPRNLGRRAGAAAPRRCRSSPHRARCRGHAGSPSCPALRRALLLPSPPGSPPAAAVASPCSSEQRPESHAAPRAHTLWTCAANPARRILLGPQPEQGNPGTTSAVPPNPLPHVVRDPRTTSQRRVPLRCRPPPSARPMEIRPAWQAAAPCGRPAARPVDVGPPQPAPLDPCTRPSNTTRTPRQTCSPGHPPRGGTPAGCGAAGSPTTPAPQNAPSQSSCNSSRRASPSTNHPTAGSAPDPQCGAAGRRWQDHQAPPPELGALHSQH